MVTTKVFDVAPVTAVPFLYHCIGVPDGVTVAVKVAVCIGVILVCDAAIVTVG